MNDDHIRSANSNETAGQIKKPNQQRRQVSVGLGGFCLKTRNRNNNKNPSNG
jgi:hypothetical protein